MPNIIVFCISIPLKNFEVFTIYGSSGHLDCIVRPKINLKELFVPQPMDAPYKDEAPHEETPSNVTLDITKIRLWTLVFIWYMT